jgi:hypothetical protein
MNFSLYQLNLTTCCFLNFNFNETGIIGMGLSFNWLICVFMQAVLKANGDETPFCLNHAIDHLRRQASKSSKLRDPVEVIVRKTKVSETSPTSCAKIKR